MGATVTGGTLWVLVASSVKSSGGGWDEVCGPIMKMYRH